MRGTLLVLTLFAAVLLGGAYFLRVSNHDFSNLSNIEVYTSVVQTLEFYESGGIIEVSGRVFECYESAAHHSDRKVLHKEVQKCMVMDRVGYQIDNAVASHLKVEPTHYFSESAYISRLQENRAKIGLTNEQANSLMEAVDLSLSNEE
jgi:hypothetical protein